MTLEAAITDVLGAIITALTATERWQAAGRFTSSPAGVRWFTALGVVFLILAAVLVVCAVRRQLVERRKRPKQSKMLNPTHR